MIIRVWIDDRLCIGHDTYVFGVQYEIYVLSCTYVEYIHIILYLAASR